MVLDYDTAKPLIRNADILLFKAKKFPGVGWWIGKYTHSPYSHAALAHVHKDDTYCLEFREFKGSRQYELDKYVEEGNKIDVFRCVDTIIYPRLINSDNPNIKYVEYNFDSDVANKIIYTALQLIGQPYSYWTIWQMFKTYIPLIRLRGRVVKNGEPEPKNFVCSTLVTYTYRKNFLDPIPFLSDSYTTPGDLARSGLFSYIFSIKS